MNCGGGRQGDVVENVFKSFMIPVQRTCGLYSLYSKSSSTKAFEIKGFEQGANAR